MEYFFPCWIALGMVYTTSEAPSQSYIHKQSKTFAKRISVCNRVANEAVRQDVDPILAIAVSKVESGFTTTTVSSKGAKGPLMVMALHHCPNRGKGKCDYVKAGISALKKVTALHPHDVCQALAVYNRGMNGLCKKGRSEYGHAQRILTVYDTLCSATDFCKSC